MNNIDLLEFDISQTQTIQMPSEDQIRKYVEDHHEKLSLVNFAKWVLEVSTR
jgi:hypothetical protein